MDAELIFAEDVEVCPKCGSSEFWENRIIWVGDDPADEELASIECKGCGATYYARGYQAALDDVYGLMDAGNSKKKTRKYCKKFLSEELAFWECGDCTKMEQPPQLKVSK